MREAGETRDPREDILMFDRDGTLFHNTGDRGGGYFYPPVEDFLREQHRTRLCVLVTASGEDFTDISRIRPSLDGKVWGFESFQCKSSFGDDFPSYGIPESHVYGFLELSGGVFVDVADPEQVSFRCDFPDTRADIRRAIHGTIIGTESNTRPNEELGKLTVMVHKATGKVLGTSNEVLAGVRYFAGKDFYMVRQTVGRGKNPRAISIGNPEDVQYLGSDPTTPHISVCVGGAWLTRGRIRALIDKLLSPGERPAEVFDALYAAGVLRSDLDFVERLPSNCYDGRFVRINNAGFALSRPRKGEFSSLPETLNDARVIVEAPIDV